MGPPSMVESTADEFYLEVVLYKYFLMLCDVEVLYVGILEFMFGVLLSVSVNSRSGILFRPLTKNRKRR